ncbi:PST family polysaccharide transporter [Scopulibacillus daqui]|uniref:PST family polysaccharide transporter n=1 Tax=Scopulibacillus daqui TaxID=1469162 RepID=A0ABS2Q2D9_9BACL|nr:polysaccharide biosynthesis protein [Scopulibacillus daqui]MBM7646458.1 PST family polysaccharide transporter [Scopulibacillus daqui]
MKHHIWRGALTLSIAAMIVKVLSAVYRLPYQNLAGDIGFYVYQQIYPFYSLAVVMGGTSFPILISKLMAEQSVHDSKGQRHVIANASIAVSGISLLLFIILFAGAEQVAKLMADPLLATPIRTISFIYLFVPFLAVLRGYFQGSFYNMTPTAASQVGEQALRVGVILGLSVLLFYKSGTPYQFGTAAAFGSMAAPAASVFILFVYFFKTQKEQRIRPFEDDVKGSGHIHFDFCLIKRLLKEGAAFTLTSLTLVSFQFIDTISLVPLLKHFHWSHPRALEGVYDRSFPIIQIGATVAGALTAAIVPAVAQIRKKTPDAELKGQLSFSLRIFITLGLAAAAGLAMIAGETNHMLFKDTKGTLSICFMSFNLLWMIMIIPSAGVLQGGTSIWRPVIYLLAALIIKVGLNIILVPEFGITGAAVATSASMGFCAYLNVKQVKKIYHIHIFDLKHKWKLALSISFMAISIFILKTLFMILNINEQSRIHAAVVAMSSVLIGAAVFLLSIVQLKFFNEKELKKLPMIDRWLGKVKNASVKE